MRFRIRHADKIVGVFLLLAVASILAVMIFLGLNQRWFEHNVAYKSRFGSAVGLNAGMPITLSGFEIGKVTEISLNDRNEVDMKFVIYEEYHSRIREYSIIQLLLSPLGIGGGGLILHIGKGETVLPAGAFIPAMDSLEGKSLISSGLVYLPEGTDQVSTLLAGVDSALADIPSLILNLNQTLRSLDGLLVSVDQTIKGNTKGPVGESLAHVNGILGRLETITGNIEKSSSALAAPDDLMVSLITKLAVPGSSIDAILNDNKELYGRVQSMLDSLQLSVKDVESLSSYLNSTRPQILGLLEDTRKTLIQSQDVLQGVKNNPLIRGGIPETPRQTAPFKSYRDENF